ncbi:MAG: hypothetical protein V3S26_06675 [Acidimicrobiia bacterium]
METTLVWGIGGLITGVVLVVTGFPSLVDLWGVAFTFSLLVEPF